MMRVKICGLRDAESLSASVSAGADYVGFVFFPRSSRYVEADRARELAETVPSGVNRVALFVDPDDASLAHVLERVPIDMVQLHGSETPSRVADVRRRFGLPVMKAVALAAASDLSNLEAYGEVADQLLCDAAPVPGARAPGGGGHAFDWQLVAGFRWPVPWMLAGGLTASNVEAAVALTGARQLDVSSGVERAPGEKDAGRIAAFVAAAKRLGE